MMPYLGLINLKILIQLSRLKEKTGVHGLRKKIDAQDFQNRALKFDKAGETEINLSEMKGHVTMD